jgi:hypothetical protein
MSSTITGESNDKAFNRHSPRRPVHGSQRELFPIRAAFEFPSISSTADAWGNVQGVNGKVYLAKGDKGGPYAKASELFCAGLAELVGLQCPENAILQIDSGELLFGSEMIQGVAGKVETSRILSAGCDPNSVGHIPGLQYFLSTVFAFDMFVHNVDRHDQNFLTFIFHGTR